MVLIAQERYQTELKAKWGRICSDLLDRFIIKEHGVVDSMIEEAIHSALDHIVPFGSAGNLIFEQTAALTSIDVNAFAGNQSAKSTRQLFTLNMQAVPEIVRNIRLKGIGGAIVIDFINMNDDNTRQMVEGEMKKLFQDDPAEVDILPISRLGLMQMTRERTGMLVNELYCEPPKPQEYSLETIVVKLLKVLQEQHEIHPQSRLKVVAHHDLIEWISSRKYWLDLLSQSAAEKIDWQHDSKCFATEPYIHIDRLQEPVFV